MNEAEARFKGQHVVELLVPSDEVDVKHIGRKVAIRMTVRTAQGVHDAMKGLEPTLQPFEELPSS